MVSNEVESEVCIHAEPEVQVEIDVHPRPDLGCKPEGRDAHVNVDRIGHKGKGLAQVEIKLNRISGK